MQLIHTPTLPPGCCFICKGSIRDSYIDTGVTLDYEGTFYICNLCIAEMAQLYFFLTPDEHKNLRLAKEDLERQVFALIKRVGELEEIDSAMARAGYVLADDGSVARLGGYISPTVEVTGKESSGAEVELGAGEGEAFEQGYDEGVGDVRSDESSSDGEFVLEL